MTLDEERTYKLMGELLVFKFCPNREKVYYSWIGALL